MLQSWLSRAQAKSKGSHRELRAAISFPVPYATPPTEAMTRSTPCLSRFSPHPSLSANKVWCVPYLPALHCWVTVQLGAPHTCFFL